MYQKYYITGAEWLLKVVSELSSSGQPLMNNKPLFFFIREYSSWTCYRETLLAISIVSVGVVVKCFHVTNYRLLCSRCAINERSSCKLVD